MALQPGLAALLQVALVDLRSGRIPSSAVLSLLFSKVTVYLTAPADVAVHGAAMLSLNPRHSCRLKERSRAREYITSGQNSASN